MAKSKGSPRHPTGAELLHDPIRNKGTAFTESERDQMGLQGLLPSRVTTQDEQVARVMENHRKKTTDLERYIHLVSLQDRNETLFYRVLGDHIEDMMPIVYTPTVGKACEVYGHIFRRSRGIFLNARHRGRMADVLRNWPADDVRVIVVTDGERILGLGDLGANGMGIPVGKLSLYTACAGIDPRVTLPITLDVGTNNDELKKDPLYIGDLAARLTGDEYDSFVEEFIDAATSVFPDALIQFEDFATKNAFRLLKHYRERVRCFNDDIQGTASVTLAGLYSAARISGVEFKGQRVLFLGAGAAAIGIGGLVVGAMKAEGLDSADAKRRCWFVDSKGLVVASRKDLAPHKLEFAHEHEPVSDFLSAIKAIKPTAVVGVSGQADAFSDDAINEMAMLNKQPVIFALSNPTSKAEATAERVYRLTEGRAIFASGSPFDPVTVDGRTLTPSQGNNAYIFPGVGLGVVASGASRVTDDMFFAAAITLAEQSSAAGAAHGSIFPPLSQIREVSAHIGIAVAQTALRQGLATIDAPDNWLEFIRSQMFDPDYRSYV